MNDDGNIRFSPWGDEETNIMKILVFSLEKQRYALPLSSTERLLRMVEVTPLPQAPGIILGLINVHGTIIPVFNIRERFGLPKKENGVHDLLILAHTSRRKVALAVEAVLGIGELPDKAAVSSEILPSLKYVSHVVKMPDGMIMITDLGVFLSLDEEENLEKAMKQEVNHGEE